MYTLTRRTYVNADSTKVVEEGSVEAALLLGNEGEEISDETAVRLGLVAGDADDAPAGYAAMKVPELRELAAERNLEVPSDAKKADIVDLLEESDAAAGAGTADAGSPAEA